MQSVCGWPCLTYRILVQVGNVEMLNCYYAHADTEEGAQVTYHL